MKTKLNSKLLLVKVDKPAEQDDKGIFVAEEWRTLPPTGVVTEVAEDVTFCKVGDRVFFTRYSADRTPWEGIRICHEDSIRAVFDG